jgi:undecaprenyl-diphosphatase
MTILQAIILGLIQGLTEFLPVSSSGHLALAQYFLKISEVPIVFDVMVHLATLLAIIIFFKTEISKLFWETLKSRSLSQIPNVVKQIVIASIPAIIVGLILNDYIDQIFGAVKFFSIGFLITSLLLFWANKSKIGKKTLEQIKPKHSLLIGLFQALAILPSISRSGATITGALLTQTKAKDAFTFSFLLAIPAIMGAFVLQIPKLVSVPVSQLPAYFIGFLLAFISGFWALKIFKKFLLNKKLNVFAIYCLTLALVIFFFFA